MRILPMGNLLFSGKQRISLSTNFKEILCLLNFLPAYHMHVGNLEDKGNISPLHEL